MVFIFSVDSTRVDDISRLLLCDLVAAWKPKVGYFFPDWRTTVGRLRRGGGVTKAVRIASGAEADAATEAPPPPLQPPQQKQGEMRLYMNARDFEAASSCYGLSAAA
jgi:hypothetical protein